MAENDKYLICAVTEGYEHVLIRCQVVRLYWTNVATLLRTCGINKDFCSHKYIL